MSAESDLCARSDVLMTLVRAAQGIWFSHSWQSMLYAADRWE